MGALIINKTSFVTGKSKIQIDIYELQTRLNNILNASSVETIKLAIHTMLDEIIDSQK